MEEELLRGCRRVGLMGGTFDPVHYGHLLAAEAAWETFGLDRVVFLPAGNPSFKQERHLASPQNRYDMVRLAIAERPGFVCSAMEITRTGVTYTVDTLEEIRRVYTGELFFITGTDAAHSLADWRDPERILELCTFVTVQRPGYQEECVDPRIRTVVAPALDVSSSELRERVAQGRSIRYLTPPAVADYIREKGLYREAER